MTQITRVLFDQTAHGGTSGSCASGYNGSCSYTCSSGTWTQSSNSCTAPTTCNPACSSGQTCVKIPDTRTLQRLCTPTPRYVCVDNCNTSDASCSYYGNDAGVCSTGYHKEDEYITYGTPTDGPAPYTVNESYSCDPGSSENDVTNWVCECPDTSSRATCSITYHAEVLCGSGDGDSNLCPRMHETAQCQNTSTGTTAEWTCWRGRDGGKNCSSTGVTNKCCVTEYKCNGNDLEYYARCAKSSTTTCAHGCWTNDGSGSPKCNDCTTAADCTARTGYTATCKTRWGGNKYCYYTKIPSSGE